MTEQDRIYHGCSRSTMTNCCTDPGGEEEAGAHRAAGRRPRPVLARPEGRAGPGRVQLGIQRVRPPARPVGPVLQAPSVDFASDVLVQCCSEWRLSRPGPRRRSAVAGILRQVAGELIVADVHEPVQQLRPPLQVVQLLVKSAPHVAGR